jgi:hypothetical protein
MNQYPRPQPILDFGSKYLERCTSLYSIIETAEADVLVPCDCLNYLQSEILTLESWQHPHLLSCNMSKLQVLFIRRLP